MDDAPPTAPPAHGALHPGHAQLGLPLRAGAADRALPGRARGRATGGRRALPGRAGAVRQRGAGRRRRQRRTGAGARRVSDQARRPPDVWGGGAGPGVRVFGWAARRVRRAVGEEGGGGGGAG